MIARFWWGSTTDNKKISWVSWKKMTRPKRNGGLGFRDLHQFNQALLANQAWKIIQRPESMVHKILKARYFRDGNLLSATSGSRPSYGWNSLRFGAELLKKGSQTSIGNGKSTNLGTDSWLPTQPPRPPTLLSTANPLSTVSDLIDENTRQWDESKMRLLIDPADHHIISKIYLPEQSTEDSFIWGHTTDGRYTVKSGYWLASTLSLEDDEPQPPLATHPDIAQGIWHLDIAPKLRHFLWRLTSRAIATAENLRHRHIKAHEFCHRCIVERETSDHIFFSCMHAQAVWRASGIPNNFLSDPLISIEDKIRFCLHLSTDTKLEKHLRYLPFWILWRLWKCRNNMVFNRKADTALDTINKAMADTKEWLDSRTIQENVSTLSNTVYYRRNQKWKKPNPGWVKCNFDVSHHEGNRSSGMGWIIRNSNGMFLTCAMGQFQGRHTIEEAESSALIWALQSAWSLGYKRVEFEGDNSTLITCVNTTSNNLRLQHYLREIHQWRSHFEQIKFSYQPRDQNACADQLARICLNSNEQWALFNSCPSFLVSYVNRDYVFAQ